VTDPEAAAAPDDRPAIRGGTWHAFLSAFCIVLAAVLVPVSILGAWVRVELVDEIRFVATLAPLADALRGAAWAPERSAAGWGSPRRADDGQPQGGAARTPGTVAAPWA